MTVKSYLDAVDQLAKFLAAKGTVPALRDALDRSDGTPADGGFSGPGCTKPLATAQAPDVDDLGGPLSLSFPTEPLAAKQRG